MQIFKYSYKDAERWDEFCKRSYNATFLHTRRFISYHRNRFNDQSLIIEDKNKKIIGLFPAAVQLENPKNIVSHPGLSYGGVITDGSLYGEKLISALEAVCFHYLDLGYEKLIYKHTPYIYHNIPMEDDLYAIFRLGGKHYRSDLSAVIDLKSRKEKSARRKRSLKKALKSNLKVDVDTTRVSELWGIVTLNLEEKHGTKPVHTLDEIELLKSRFPDFIKTPVVLLNDKIIAGLVLFHCNKVTHAQYISSNNTGKNVCALDLLFDIAINNAKNEGMRYFDFGISNENEGRLLNESLYKFKHEFGAGSVVHNFYNIDLKK